MKLQEIPAGCYTVRCEDCWEFVAFHPEDADSPGFTALVDRAMADHKILCLGQLHRPCTQGGDRHCDCSPINGRCCWCDASIEPA